MTFLFIIAIAVVGWLLYTVHLKKMLNQGKAGKIKLALIALGLIFLVMAASGRAPALFAVIGAAMTQVMRFIPLLIKFAPSLSRHLGGMPGMSSGAKSSGASTVNTATLTMSLNHATGGIAGDVINGPLTGRTLDSLSVTELKSLYQFCSQNDAEALRLLQTYIQRQRASEWQEANPGHGNGAGDSHSGVPSSSTMSVEEARLVLGISGEISRKSVTAAHRSLMGQFHPDKGGSDYLATKINSARQILLSSLKERS